MVRIRKYLSLRMFYVLADGPGLVQKFFLFFSFERMLTLPPHLLSITLIEDVLPRIDNVLALECTHFFISFLNMSDCPDLQVLTEPRS